MWSGLGTALVGGALSSIGSYLGSSLTQEYSEEAAETAYERQLELLGIQQKYATDMSNTSYQRGVKDLKKAGLNPILAATGGQGASTPVVSTPSVNSANTADFGDLGLGKAGELIGKSSSQSLAAAEAKQVEPNAKSQRQVNETQSALNQANASSAKAKAELDKSQVALNNELIETEKVKQQKYQAETDKAGTRDVRQVPWEAFRFVRDKLYNSAKSSAPDSAWKRDMQEIGRKGRDYVNSSGKSDSIFSKFPERYNDTFEYFRGGWHNN